MSLTSQRGGLARREVTLAVLAAARAKLKRRKFGQLSNSATKAGAVESTGVKRRHEEEDLYLCLY